MAKVTGRELTEDELREMRLKTWYCQTCGGELDQRREDDPTRRIACGGCGDSWWATSEPAAEDVTARMAARRG